MKKIAILGLLSLTVFATNCKSQESNSTTNQQKTRGGQEKDPFTEMDVNNDGLLTKAEAKGPIANDFAKIDTDGDGIITRAEFDKAPKPPREGGDRPARR